MILIWTFAKLIRNLFLYGNHPTILWRLKNVGILQRKGVHTWIRLGNCFNGRTIKTNRRIESSHDEKANVKFERGKCQGKRATTNPRNFFKEEGSTLYFGSTWISLCLKGGIGCRRDITFSGARQNEHLQAEHFAKFTSDSWIVSRGH